MPALFADVIIDISNEAVDKIFQYRVPEELCKSIEIGMQVIIPFGKGNTKRKGYVVGLGTTTTYNEDLIKSIIEIDKSVAIAESQFIKLAAFIKEKYGSTMINALKTVLPVKEKIKNKEEKTIHLLLDKNEGIKQLQIYKTKNNKARERLLNELIEEGDISFSLAVSKLNIAPSTINGMIEQKVVEVTTKRMYRNVGNTQLLKEETSNSLNKEQLEIYEEFAKDYESGIRKTYLLYGVTGSGKTQVYIEAIKKVVSQGKQAIVLIPEIALTFQNIKRFRREFGERVTIINSRLSKGEKYDQFEKAKNHCVDVIIGPRSALFTPFDNLGLIIIDEEHETSYKSDYPPKYHAREVAIERARMSQASVILGSATPSIDSFTKAKIGEYKLFQLKNRANGEPMADVDIVDLREELKKGNRSIISGRLEELIAQKLEKKQQIMLFINRRGYAGFVSCRSCGKVIKCPHCDVSLSMHNDGTLKCHYCGHEEKQPKVCPKCGSNFIAGFGIGTEKVLKVINDKFPQAKTIRMDADTTKNKNDHENILKAFENGEADILVGTQMIVKGHDFSNVTLVGIIAADLSLFSNDYRASERTFDLLTQAAGRAGRGNLKGNVVIQTYAPDNYSIIAASKQDYEAFYEQEIQFRRILKYPPVYNMLLVFITSKNSSLADSTGKLVAESVRSYFKNKETLRVVGPGEATIGKVKDIYRRVVYIKNFEYNVLVEIKDYIESNINIENTNIQFDFNPMNMY